MIEQSRESPRGLGGNSAKSVNIAPLFSLTEASRCDGMKSFPVSLSGGAPVWQGEGLELQAPEVFQSLSFLETDVKRA